MPTKRKQVRKGGSLQSTALGLAKKLNKELKKTKVLSKKLSEVSPLLGSAVSMAGYGRRKPRKPRRRRRKAHCQQGGSILGDILGKVSSIPAGTIIGATSGLHGALAGLGRKKRAPRRGGSIMPIKSGFWRPHPGVYTTGHSRVMA